MDHVAAFLQPRLLAVAVLLSGSLFPFFTYAECVPIKESDSARLKYHLPDSCSAKEKEEHPIPAKEIVGAIKSAKAVDIENAVIQGPFILRSLSVGEEISIRRTKVTGPVDWSYAIFKGVLRLQRTTFERDVHFTGVTLEKDIFLDRATFKGEADFLDLKVAGVLFGRSARFMKGAIFNRAVFEKSALFREETNGEKTIFWGEADFTSARFGGADFAGAVFKKGASFAATQIKGAAFFDRTGFESEANFVSAQIGATAEFTEAVFKQQAQFDRARVDEDAFFRSANFEGKASFRGARIKGSVDFTEAVFREEAQFDRVRVEESMFFSSATFDKTLTLYSASVSGDIFFDPVNFGSQLEVDLRGCNYTRIYFSWKSLKDRLRPSDAQVYKQLEQALRRSGENALASEIYYYGRGVEGNRIKFTEETFQWLNDRRQRWLVSYGQNPFKLLWIFLASVGIGSYIFQRKGAVEPKDREKCPLHPASPCDPAGSHHLSWGAAFWVSTEAFLPGVEIKAAGSWDPSVSNRFLKITYAGWATLLRLVGWITLVLGFFALPDFLLR